VNRDGMFILYPLVVAEMCVIVKSFGIRSSLLILSRSNNPNNAIIVRMLPVRTVAL